MRRVTWVRCALGLALAGCSFSPAGGPGSDGRPGGDDDAPPPPDARDIDARVIDGRPAVDVAFLDTANEQPGTGDWVITENVDIDTDLDPANPRVTGLPSGVTFTLQQQQGAPAARTILVMHVRRLEIEAGAAIALFGSRPFAIVAGDEVVVDGRIDASADHGVAGPGGYSGTSDVAGAGGGGAAGTVTVSDSGGGGGGHGTAGGRGGGVACAGDTCGLAPGGPGSPINDNLFYLGGGGRGGRAASRTSCESSFAGAGGGGLLVYSPTSIAVGNQGVIVANGGGGSGGRHCGNNGTLAGAGGGAGGQVDLQAPSVVISNGGLVVANGGGGGGGANGTQTQNPGVEGGNGAESLTTPPVIASGGAGGAPGGNGGLGSIMNGAGGQGVDVVSERNAGGGGGGAGRITIRYRGIQPQLATSPGAKYVSY